MAFRLHSYAQKISSIEFNQAYCQVNRPTIVLLDYKTDGASLELNQCKLDNEKWRLFALERNRMTVSLKTISAGYCFVQGCKKIPLIHKDTYNMEDIQSACIHVLPARISWC